MFSIPSPAVILPLKTYEYNTKLKDFTILSCSLLLPLGAQKAGRYFFPPPPPPFFSSSSLYLIKMVLFSCCISIFLQVDYHHDNQTPPKNLKNISSPEIMKSRQKNVCLHIRNLMRESQPNELSFAEQCDVVSHFYLFLW